MSTNIVLTLKNDSLFNLATMVMDLPLTLILDLIRKYFFFLKNEEQIEYKLTIFSETYIF